MSDTSEIQQRLGVSQTDVWNEVSENGVRQYQRTHGLAATGNPDPFTLAAMGIYDPVAGTPGSFQRYLAGGSEPSSFGRDLATASNQVPRWGWVTLGVALYGLAYLSWMRRGRDK